ncbi:MAG: hypothetical protein LBU34_09135 [Planctomycetaceae bacterium]|jgi:hypothetical protein|nr:hypothetical protein [Planctomycetaceae bacterium]
MKKIVNSLFLSMFLYPCAGMADYVDMNHEQAYLLDIDPNNKSQVVDVIQSIFIPYYQSNYSPEELLRMKNALQYYLATNNIDFSQEYNSQLMPFDHPQNAKDFFLWIWETCFPNEHYELSIDDEYIVITHIWEDYKKIRKHPC